MKAYRLITLIITLILSFQVYAIDKNAFRELRDQGIQNIGWVAGNSSKHPIWPQMKPFVGRGGTYYETLVRLKVPGSDSQTEAYSNVALYRKWKNIGSKITFNEAECMNRIKRTIQITKELSDLMR